MYRATSMAPAMPIPNNANELGSGTGTNTRAHAGKDNVTPAAAKRSAAFEVFFIIFTF
jgi:hypothetical protein